MVLWWVGQARSKVRAAILRSKKYLPASLGHQIEALATPESLAIITTALVIWAGSHFCGVGEVVDVGLLLVGAFFIGWSIEAIARDLCTFGTRSVSPRGRGISKTGRLFNHVCSSWRVRMRNKKDGPGWNRLRLNPHAPLPGRRRGQSAPMPLHSVAMSGFSSENRTARSLKPLICRVEHSKSVLARRF